MPTTGDRFEDTLIELFLSVYDGGSWSPGLATRVSPERMMDGAVEMIATRTVDLESAREHGLKPPNLNQISVLDQQAASYHCVSKTGLKGFDSRRLHHP